jgi:acyl-coenzyme A synthetase/AMP-(fatty) acid ligase
LRTWRLVISAGAVLAPELAREFRDRFHIRIHNFYGSSETGGITFDRSGEATLAGRSVGTPLDGVRLSFARGGIFRVESPAVFTLGNPKGTPSLGIHSPPDRGRPAEGGELVLFGRRGRLIKLAGRRLDPAEVERALCALPGVKAAFVAAHPGRADALAAVIGGTATADAVRAGLRERLAPWKIPRLIVPLRDFPATARGKPDTARLRSLLGY